MKKKVNIEILIDTDHPERNKWLKERDFISQEFVEILGEVCPFATNAVPRNCNGVTQSRATTFKMRVTNLTKDKK